MCARSAARSRHDEAPDAAAYVRHSISASPYRYVARVRYQAPEHVVAQHFSPASVTIEADGPDACIVTAGADDPERMVFYLALPGCDFEVLEPPEVVRAVGSLAERLRRAVVSRWLWISAVQMSVRPIRWCAWPRWKTSKRASRRLKLPRLTIARFWQRSTHWARTSATMGCV